jgi:hypothetical protein
MSTATLHRTAAAQASPLLNSLMAKYPPLNAVTNPNVPTAQAGFYLDRRPQTLRIWALTGHPIMPLRVNGRLAWPVSEIKRLLGMGV